MAKLSKIILGSALAGAAVAGTIAYLKKQENSDTKDELNEFKEDPDCDEKDTTCDCGCSHKEEYKTIAAETFDGVKDIVVDAAKNLTDVAKNAYGRVKVLKENPVCEQEQFFEDLDEEFEEFDEALEQEEQSDEADPIISVAPVATNPDADTKQASNEDLKVDTEALADVMMEGKEENEDL